MLKAHVDNELWLVQQPDHAQLAGYLAAHWGGVNGFAQPGHYPGATDPARWRDEVVLGVAEHDNGWWETEAMPHISDQDGLPVGVGEAAPATAENEFGAWTSGGFDRWRIGIDRIAGPHPYGALLTSLHAYWLYAVAFDDMRPAIDEHLRHFVFGAPETAAGLVGDEANTRAFLAEQSDLQDALKARLMKDPAMAGAITPDHLIPHFRLLQLFDSMSLFLALNDTDKHVLKSVPRGSWIDRVDMTWRRVSPRTIALDPYPFSIDGLKVAMPARVVHVQTQKHAGGEEPPMSRFLGTALETIDFLFVSEQNQESLRSQSIRTL